MSRLLTACVMLVGAAPAFAASDEVLSLKTQEVGGGTYFQIDVKAPRDLHLPGVRDDRFYSEKKIRTLSQLPRLVPLDGHARAVYLDHTPIVNKVAIDVLRFHGLRATKDAGAGFRLAYPVATKAKPGLAGLPNDSDVATVDVTVTWAHAEEGFRLREHWARSQGEHLERQHLRAHQAGIFALAEEIGARKYELRKGSRTRDPIATSTGSLLDSVLGLGNEQFYELTTGATALTESLALGRVWATTPEKAPRTVDVTKLPGIDVAEHPWEKMMAGKKPATEPLARLVPHDNWYLTVGTPAAFLAAWDVLDGWGGSVLRSPKLQDRDHGLRARYERQLGLPSAELVKALPADLVEGIALTGSDLFFVEGSDVTALIEVKDPAAFRKAQDAFLARATAGRRPTVGVYRELSIESFVTPFREVSLHRATIGKVVVCSNSPTAIRHVIDAHAGERKALSASLDFQYMRTAFVRDAKDEDGFAFLSDAFVRRLVGPATRIKERRRQQARAALTLAGAAALFVGTDTGKPPADTKALLADSALQADRLAVPEGGPVEWDGKATRAVSEVYNTLEFSTPLIELPITMVTADEQSEYERFRGEYLRLWRRFFDPVGIRFKLAKEATRVEVYLLPLVNNSAYNNLRQWAGGGLVRFSPSRIPTTTLARFATHLRVEESLLANSGIGNWAYLHLDATDLNLGAFVRQQLQSDLELKPDRSDLGGLPLLFAGAVADAEKVKKTMDGVLNRSGETKEGTHRGVAVTEYRSKTAPDDWLLSRLLSRFYAAIHEKSFAVSLNKPLLHRWIDEQIDGAKTKPTDTVEANTSLYLAPPAGKQLDALSAGLDWEAHKRALSACAVWQGLHAAGLLPARLRDGERQDAARRLLGFAPVSPDGSAFVYDDKFGEMTNQRHGSPSRPTFHARLDPTAGVAKLFGQLRNVRADLRFREDGIHTVVTLNWK